MIPYPPIKPVVIEPPKKHAPFTIQVSKPDEQMSQLRSFMGDGGMGDGSNMKKPRKHNMVSGWTEDQGKLG